MVFSSWVEQTVVANGRVTELASGAATGTWSDASEHNLVGGGSYENPSSDFCKYRVPLSIANYADSAGFCHGSGNHVTGEAGIAHTRVSAKDFLTGEELENVKNEDISINVPVVINKNETYIQYTLANVYINSDIVYGAEQYEELSEIPKAVIAANNIIISCDVNRVDAILVAKNKVTSCDDYTGKDGMANQPERARQLTINGLVSTGELELGRTYGMSNGIASRIPAEIVNYDVSVLLWINGRNTTDDYDKVYQAYLNELAPRY